MSLWFKQESLLVSVKEIAAECRIISVGFMLFDVGFWCMRNRLVAMMAGKRDAQVNVKSTEEILGIG